MLDLTTLHPLDAAIMSSLPVIAATRHQRLPALAVGERRLILAADAVLLEIRSSALHACVPIGEVWHPTPFAAVEPFIRLAGGPVPRTQYVAMVDAALQAHPRETARLVHWAENGYRLTEPVVSASDIGHVRYEDVLDDDHLVLDMHSHGSFAAYFSSTDDASDLSRPGPYIAVVFGRCESKASIEVAARLCSGPFLVPIDLDDYRIFEASA